MTKLHFPLKNELETSLDESETQRIWSGIQRRRRGSWIAARRPSPALALGFALSCAAALLLFLVLRGRQAPAPMPIAGPLLTQGGAPLSVLGGPMPSSDALSDGSRISLDAGSVLDVLENSSKSFVSVLRRGRGSFEVHPGGPRRWLIEAGLATIEVLGTGFTVSRGAGSVEIRVRHGVVLVRSELIEDHVQRLTAGQRVLIEAPHTPPIVEEKQVARAVPDPGAHPAPVAPSLDALLRQADDLRSKGDVRGAEASLRRALAEHAHEPQAALAAFTLGKLLADVAGRPAAAVQAFRRCLDLSPPSALSEDALFRLSAAQRSAGDTGAASATAETYRARYPHGRYLSELERWGNAH